MAFNYSVPPIRGQEIPKQRNYISVDNLGGYINAGGPDTQIQEVDGYEEERLVPLLVLPEQGRLGIEQVLPDDYNPTVIDRQIAKFIKRGLRPILIGAGSNEDVAEHIEHTWGHIDHVSVETFDEELGHGGDLIRAYRISPDKFNTHTLIQNGDTIQDLDLDQFYTSYLRHSASLMIALSRAEDAPEDNVYNYDKENFVVSSAEADLSNIHGAVVDEDTRKRLKTGFSTGTLLMNQSVMRDSEWDPESGQPLSLYENVVASEINRGGMYAFDNGERIFLDVGDDDGWRKLQEHPDFYLAS